MNLLPPDPAQSQSPVNLLIVDDDTRIRTLLQRYLSEAGYRVTAAKDAAEARQLMGRPPDPLINRIEKGQ